MLLHKLTDFYVNYLRNSEYFSRLSNGLHQGDLELLFQNMEFLNSSYHHVQNIACFSDQFFALFTTGIRDQHKIKCSKFNITEARTAQSTAHQKPLIDNKLCLIQLGRIISLAPEPLLFAFFALDGDFIRSATSVGNKRQRKYSEEVYPDGKLMSKHI